MAFRLLYIYRVFQNKIIRTQFNPKVITVQKVYLDQFYCCVHQSILHHLYFSSIFLFFFLFFYYFFIYIFFIFFWILFIFFCSVFYSVFCNVFCNVFLLFCQLSKGLVQIMKFEPFYYQVIKWYLAKRLCSKS